MAVEIDPQLKEKLLDELLSGLQTDGGHHKQYALEQAVKLLTDCPTITVDAVDYKGRPYSYEALGESEEFLEFKRGSIDPEDLELYLSEGYEPDEILAEAWEEGIA